MLVRVGMVQMRPVLGDVAGNVRLHVEWVERAAEAGCGLVVFPELSLTGYGLKDLAYDCARTLEDEEIRPLLEASRRVDVVFGMVELSRDYTVYNSAVYASGGAVVHLHRKVYVPTYGMFEENRHFGRGKQIRAFDTAWGRVGIMVCEDAWHPSVPYVLSQDGATVLICPSASPARPVRGDRPGSQEIWHRAVRMYAQLFGAYVLFVNRVGVEDGVLFYGASALVDPFGEVIASAPMFDETLVVAELDGEVLRRSRSLTPLAREEQLDVTFSELSRIMAQRYGGRWIPGAHR
ncbi:MAG: nitrilase-related carbon-nitrogen hydrolase [Alicyclobacillaceae bacterium]|nr:nitrilase-related carbon-nitrogen hydrolase [Alicyclobacillaceae bacterium]